MILREKQECILARVERLEEQHGQQALPFGKGEVMWQDLPTVSEVRKDKYARSLWDE